MGDKPTLQTTGSGKNILRMDAGTTFYQTKDYGVQKVLTESTR